MNLARAFLSPGLLFSGLLLLPLTAAMATPAADASWATVTGLDHPPNVSAKNREQARSAGLAHLRQQEAALRSFLQQHASDPRSVDARLRLAHLYTMLADFSGNTAYNATAQQLLSELEKTAPQSRMADVSFARLSLNMRGVVTPTDKERRALSDAIHGFQHRYPDDRRIAALLTELASLYDHEPKQKQRYLNLALRNARSEEMKARILDDLKRLALLGKPLELTGTSPDGRTVSAESLRGRVVLIYFTAGWSPPGLAAMEEVNYLRRTFPESRLAVIGVSLDPTPEAFAVTASRAVGNWLWIQETEGWQSPTLRRLGINALPILWVLDRQGRLRTLNARTDSEALVRSLLR